jgi:hypothetical protein
MKNHSAVTVPEVLGIDLSYRPTTYFGPLPLEVRTLSRITGYQRREILRNLLSAGDDNYPPELEQSTLDEAFRTALGRIHPMYMGGEYLPPLGKNETEIARISLASTTADQISVRARRLKDRIAFRIVDEYPDAEQPYDCRPCTSRQPLTLGELVALLDRARDYDGAVFGPIVFNIESCGRDADEYEDFVSVSSEFYPQLHDYYDARLAAYFDAFRNADNDAMPDGAALARSKAIR